MDENLSTSYKMNRIAVRIRPCVSRVADAVIDMGYFIVCGGNAAGAGLHPGAISRARRFTDWPGRDASTGAFSSHPLANVTSILTNTTWEMLYQEYRAQAKTQVQNKINLITTNLTYQWTPRISFEIDAPWLFATRKSQNSPIKYSASGLGDTIIGANSWIRNPEHAVRNNFSIGLGGIDADGQ